MDYTKSVIFMILPLLFAPLVYGVSFTTNNACAAPADNNWYDSNTCGQTTTNPQTGRDTKTCCWKETRIHGKLPPLNEAMFCQTCSWDPKNPNTTTSCGPKVAQSMTVTPEKLEDLPTLEQAPTNPSTPPISGENTNVPPIRNMVEQPPTVATTQPAPDGSGNVPDETEVITESPQTSQTAPPQNDQSDTDQEDTSSNSNNRDNIPLDSGVITQSNDEES